MISHMATQTVSGAGGALPMRERVAAEVRALLGRRKINGTALADLLTELRRLDAERRGEPVPPPVTQRWVSRRLNAEVAFDVDDLDAISRALDVPVSTFLAFPPYPTSPNGGGQPTVAKVAQIAMIGRGKQSAGATSRRQLVAA